MMGGDAENAHGCAGAVKSNRTAITVLCLFQDVSDPDQYAEPESADGHFSINLPGRGLLPSGLADLRFVL